MGSVGHAPDIAKNAVLVKSVEPEERVICRGYDKWEERHDGNIDYNAMFESLQYTGFQATSFGLAVNEIRRMLKWRMSDEKPSEDDRDEYKVDVLVTTAGGVEEDYIKCMAPTYMGDFYLKGKDLREKGLNRIGNLLVPNDNYCKFEDWIMPIFETMWHEQQEQGVVWTPSTVIHRLGKEINHPDSVYYWAYKNNIPVFCPAITDGSLGDMLYFHSYKHETPITVDLVRDIRKINDIAVRAPKTGMLILGAGVVKHHICNANLMRNGADFSVYINTAAEYDGSDAGARPDEAVSWGKIKIDAKPVKLYGDASLLFPLLVSQTFAHSKSH